jgi:hypothetical protein
VFAELIAVFKAVTSTTVAVEVTVSALALPTSIANAITASIGNAKYLIFMQIPPIV